MAPHVTLFGLIRLPSRRYIWYTTGNIFQFEEASTMKRREFLMGTAATALLARRGRAQGSSREAKMARIGIMCGGFGGQLVPFWDRTEPVDQKRLDNFLDLPDLLAERHGLHNLDIQTPFFPSTEPAFVARFIERLKKARKSSASA